MSPEALALVPLDQLLGEVFRRCGLTVVADMSASARGGHMSAPVSACPPVDTSEIEQRRARWRRQKQAQRFRRTADMSTADTADTPVVVNRTTNTTTTADMSTADADIADALPGLARPVGSAPDPTPAPPDDLVRRKLRTATVELLARQALDRARAAGTVIHNMTGYVRKTERTIAVDRADEITAAIEAAMSRYPHPDAAHVVTCMQELGGNTRARRVEQPVDRSPRPPQHEVFAGLEQIRNALRRTA